MFKSLKGLFWILFGFLFIGIIGMVGYWIWYQDGTGYLPQHMFGGFMMPFGMIGMAIFWVITLYLVFILIDKFHHRNEKTVIELLQVRLAKGEISIEEYDTLVKKARELNK